MNICSYVLAGDGNKTMRNKRHLDSFGISIIWILFFLLCLIPSALFRIAPWGLSTDHGCACGHPSIKQFGWGEGALLQKTINYFLSYQERKAYIQPTLRK